MQDRSIYISLNSDKEFLLFNQVQRQYNKTLRLNKNLVLSKKEIYLKLTEKHLHLFRWKSYKRY